VPPSHPSKSNPYTDNESIDELIQQISAEDSATRCQAIKTLGQLGPEASSALPPIRKALHDSDFRIRLEAAIALGFIGTKDDTQYLLPLLDDEVEVVRFQTISAIAFLRDAHATPELLTRYEHETLHVKDQILRALGHLGGNGVYDLLQRELIADHPILRTGAVVGFGFLGDPSACRLLQDVAEKDSNRIVAHEARIAILQLQELSNLGAIKSRNNLVLGNEESKEKK
jgi:HEAT repeat protein